MTEHGPYPRFVRHLLDETLGDTPVTLIHGPRQAGKTTLARSVAEMGGFAYFTFDDTATLEAATADPMGFVADLPARAILDEVQRAPRIFAPLKIEVDRKREPGRFLLTGSANVLAVPKLSDSLAGRMGIVRLHPLAQCELARREPDFVDSAFGDRFGMKNPGTRLRQQLAARIVDGGYPAALARTNPQRRASWYREYAETIVERDVRDLARIASLDALPRLLTLVAGQSARLLNVTDLASPFQLARPTIRDYLTLLERLFLVDELPPWHTNRTSRLIKTPKVHVCDTGVACALLGVDADALWSQRELFGQLLESFVVQEIRRQTSWRDDGIRLFHFRDHDGAEVDLVMERGPHQLVGIEVKAASTVTKSDFAGLRRLRTVAGDRFVAGIVLYDGDVSLPFGDGLRAVPISRLWEGPDAGRP